MLFGFSGERKHQLTKMHTRIRYENAIMTLKWSAECWKPHSCREKKKLCMCTSKWIGSGDKTVSIFLMRPKTEPNLLVNGSQFSVIFLPAMEGKTLTTHTKTLDIKFSKMMWTNFLFNPTVQPISSERQKDEHAKAKEEEKQQTNTQRTYDFAEYTCCAVRKSVQRNKKTFAQLQFV